MNSGIFLASKPGHKKAGNLGHRLHLPARNGPRRSRFFGSAGSAKAHALVDEGCARGALCYARLCYEGETAQSIARLWRELPPDKQGIRCHYAHFGLRFYGAELLLLEASVCWKCHNIFGASNGIEVFGEFDAGHPRAQELLALLQQVWNEKEQL